MNAEPRQSVGGKQPASDTKRTAPRRMLMFIVPLAITALIVMLVGMHFLSGMK